MKKQRLLSIGTAICCACMFTSSLAACGSKDTDDGEAVRVPYVAADCTHDGNIEYFTKGDKFYSDEACETEIDEAATVIDALGHDFSSGAYGKDYSGHWLICAREGCDATGDKSDGHTYVDGKCVCGFEEPDDPPAPPAPPSPPDTSVTYDITVSDSIENGAVTASAAKAAEGATVTLTVTPDSGYHVKNVKVNGTEVTKASGAYTFAMLGEEVAVTAEFEAHTQKDGYEKGEGKHWHICETCGELMGNKENCTYSVGTCSTCGDTNGFEGYSVKIDEAAGEACAVTRTDTASSLKLKIDRTNNTDWHIKLENDLHIDGLAVGQYYEIEYDINVISGAGGDIWLESGRVNYASKATLVSGSNTAVFRFAVGEVREGEKVYLALKLGQLPADTEIELTGAPRVTNLTATDNQIQGYENAFDANSGENASGSAEYNGTNKTLVITNASSTKTGGDIKDWHIKITKNVDVTQDRVYEITYVFSSTKSGNTSYNVNDNVANFNINGNNWKVVAEGMNVITFTFTATQTVTDKYACYQIGEIARNGAFDATFYYINFREVGTANA